MTEVIVAHLRPDRIMDIVRELRQQGLKQGQDFDFYFENSHWDSFTGEEKIRRTRFVFYTEKYATMFALRYGS